MTVLFLYYMHPCYQLLRGYQRAELLGKRIFLNPGRVAGQASGGIQCD
ncbi:hypothetical protein [Candidatus Contubernalis alkaliaceticus]|nr:hypothetical protein [Candidatus Contubernalis alkalaceticus]UNC93095.1 hypothetical protein HUE98_13940 [Candidatus Contubernalis alkalaceticus]